MTRMSKKDSEAYMSDINRREAGRQLFASNEPGDSPTYWADHRVTVYQRSFRSARKAHKMALRLRREYPRADHYSVMGYADYRIDRKAA